MSALSPTRRQVLAALGAVFAALAGCKFFVKRPRPICPGAIDPQARDKPLTIDVHAHIFNASDLQVRRFVELIASRQQEGGLADLAKNLGKVLQNVAWREVPDGAAERRQLARLADELSSCTPEAFTEALRQLQNDQYELGRTELQEAATAVAPTTQHRALDPSVPSRTLAPEELGVREVMALPRTLDEFDRRRAAPAPAGDEFEALRASILGAIRFALEHFQYRYVSYHTYAKTYVSASRSVDLALASLVDYDWWLNDGAPTPTSIAEQCETMASIAIATGGRVHAFAPFCPYRELAHRLDAAATPSSLATVKHAVTERGAIGIKLYPPMGFAPLGNEHLNRWADKPWLGAIAKRPDFGARLDAAMRDLLRWCRDEHVPIMAHTNRSNGAADVFEEFADHRHWRTALGSGEFPALAVNFGHFGGLRAGGENTAGYLGLMERDPGSAGSRAYADSSYFADTLDHPQQLEMQLRSLFESDSRRGAVLQQRFMFGSDWKMLLLESRSDSYLAAMEGVIARVAAALGSEFATFPDAFFGGNAAGFLMLRKGEPVRRRLEAFYARETSGLTPLWMQKVDRATS